MNKTTRHKYTSTPYGKKYHIVNSPTGSTYCGQTGPNLWPAAPYYVPMRADVCKTCAKLSS